MTRIILPAMIYLIISGYIAFLNFGGFEKILNDVRTIASILINIFAFWLVLGGFAGLFYDAQQLREIHNKIHFKFLLFGLSSFFRKVRHEFICDKCF